MSKALILGSSSPRRAEILSYFTLPFEVHKPDFDEESLPYLNDPEAYVRELALGKAHSLRFPDRLILTADTVVEKEGKIFNKPHDEQEALEMLRELNGSWHVVYTAVCGKRKDQVLCQVAKTRILFHSATTQQLAAYHASFHGKDKAGGYGIQEGGGILVKKIEGCFYNVMGLPISTLVDVLAHFGVDLWQYLKPY